MSAGSRLWRSLRVGLLTLARTVLRTVASEAHRPRLAGAPVLFCAGRGRMARVMRESGLAATIPLATLLRLVPVLAVAVLWSGGRQTTVPVTGLAAGAAAAAPPTARSGSGQ